MKEGGGIDLVTKSEQSSIQEDRGSANACQPVLLNGVVANLADWLEAPSRQGKLGQGRQYQL